MIISDRHKKMLLVLIEDHLPVDIDVIAFGSRVEGHAHAASDLDLALKSTGGIKLDKPTVLNFLRAVKESNIPFLIDVLDYYAIPPYMQKNIDASEYVLRKGIAAARIVN